MKKLIYIVSWSLLSSLNKIIDDDMKETDTILRSFSDTDHIPVLFLGHGSPMNAIEVNQFVQGFRKVRDGIPKPNAILVISAHWETEGTRITAMEKPGTIHDFQGLSKGVI